LALAGGSRAAEPDKGAEPGLVVHVKSLDGLLEDVSYVAKAVGKEEEAKQFEKMILAQAGEKGLKGFDRTKPIGLYGTFGQTAFDSTVVGMIPVKDEDAVLGLLENLNLKAEKGSDGIYEVTGQQVPVYFRFANGYAYVSALNKGVLAKDKLVAPADVLPAQEKALASIVLRVDRVPEAIKQQALEQIKDKLNEEKEKREPNETDAQHKAKELLIEGAIHKYTMLLRDTRRLALRAEVDRQAEQLVLEASQEPVPGSEMAGLIERVGGQKSLFAGLAGKPAALDLLAHFQLPEETVKPLLNVLNEAATKELAKQEDKEKREQAEKLLKALMPTLKAGELDLGFTLRGPSADKTYTVVGGLKVQDGQALEKTLRQLIESEPADKRKEVHFDAAKVGDVSVHRIDVSGHLDEHAKKLFGAEAELYVAFRPDAVLVTFGQNGLEAMKEAVAMQPQVGPPLMLNAALARLAPLMAKDNPGAVKAAEEAFKRKGSDLVRLEAGGGKAARVSFRLTPEVLHFISLADAAKKAEKDKP
jgi:hypothetical protein